MYTTQQKPRSGLVLTVPAATARARFVGRQRNGGGVHQDKRRRKDRSRIKIRLRGDTY